MAKISIITPLYNREDIVQKTIDSVLDQTFTDWEHIIVDDGSTDKSWFVIASYAEMDNRIRVFKRYKEPKGGSTCRNIGVEYATSDLIIFLDSDDILEPHCLEQRYAYMHNNPHIDLGVFPFIIEMETEDNTFIRRIVDPEVKGRDYLRRILSFDIPWQTTAPVWRKEFFLSLGGFDVEFRRFQDVELTIRALTGKARIEVVDGCHPDYVYYLHSKFHDFDANYSAQLHLLELTATGFSLKYRKLLASYLRVFLVRQHQYSKQITFANYKRTKKLINEYYNHKIISLKQAALLKLMMTLIYIAEKNRIACQKYLKKIIK